MKKLKKSMVIVLTLLVVLGNTLVVSASNTGDVEVNVMQVNAAESTQGEDEGANYVIGYIVPNDSAYSFSDKGMVTTNGLNLRKEPTLNSTILEVMYFGEMVKIDLDNSTATFYYVERNETKTKGYASRDYIQIAGDAK